MNWCGIQFNSLKQVVGFDFYSNLNEDLMY